MLGGPCSRAVPRPPHSRHWTTLLLSSSPRWSCLRTTTLLASFGFSLRAPLKYCSSQAAADPFRPCPALSIAHALPSPRSRRGTANHNALNLESTIATRSCHHSCRQPCANWRRGSGELCSHTTAASMEDRESSVASSADFYGTEESPISHPNDALDVNTNGVAKRKAEDLLCDQEKKRKLDSLPSPLLSSISSDLRPCARLPPSVWQHIFLSCSLADLGRLIQVNRSFLSYLTDVRNVSTSRPDPGCVRLLKSESLWASARNALPTKPPRPLPGFTELQMWQLAWSKRCQFCEKLNSFVPGERIWQKGPGTNGVRTIWPFAIRACGPCLLDRCQTVS